MRTGDNRCTVKQNVEVHAHLSRLYVVR